MAALSEPRGPRREVGGAALRRRGAPRRPHAHGAPGARDALVSCTGRCDPASPLATRLASLAVPNATCTALALLPVRPGWAGPRAAGPGGDPWAGPGSVPSRRPPAPGSTPLSSPAWPFLPHAGQRPLCALGAQGPLPIPRPPLRGPARPASSGIFLKRLTLLSGPSPALAVGWPRAAGPERGVQHTASAR